MLGEYKIMAFNYLQEPFLIVDIKAKSKQEAIHIAREKYDIHPVLDTIVVSETKPYLPELKPLNF